MFDKVQRIEELKKEAANALREAMRLADEVGVVVSFEELPLSESYGMGGLRYVPSASAEDDGYGYNRYGWMSSASDSC